MAAFIRAELTLHVAAEEELFFPVLRERCFPEHEIGGALEPLNLEHVEDRDLSASVRIVLLKAGTEGKPPAAIEGAVLIPLARRRLTSDDWTLLGKRLAARRQTGRLTTIWYDHTQTHCREYALPLGPVEGSTRQHDVARGAAPQHASGSKIPPEYFAAQRRQHSNRQDNLAVHRYSLGSLIRQTGA